MKKSTNIRIISLWHKFEMNSYFMIICLCVFMESYYCICFFSIYVHSAYDMRVFPAKALFQILIMSTFIPSYNFVRQNNKVTETQFYGIHRNIIIKYIFVNKLWHCRKEVHHVYFQVNNLCFVFLVSSNRLSIIAFVNWFMACLWGCQ